MSEKSRDLTLALEKDEGAIRSIWGSGKCKAGWGQGGSGCVP
jgi:hypothetical protein